MILWWWNHTRNMNRDREKKRVWSSSFDWTTVEEINNGFTIEVFFLLFVAPANVRPHLLILQNMMNVNDNPTECNWNVHNTLSRWIHLWRHIHAISFGKSKFNLHWVVPLHVKLGCSDYARTWFCEWAFALIQKTTNDTLEKSKPDFFRIGFFRIGIYPSK